MKIRMTMLDLRAVVCHMKSLVGCRLVNIYNVDKKKYLLKFGRSGDETKYFLFIDSGTRIHMTKYDREKSGMPNTFVMKIRKTIKGRVLREVKQLGVDRIICLTFGPQELDVENSNHLIAEFFSRGNVLLTDGGYNIVTLLRSHHHDVSSENQKKENENTKKNKNKQKKKDDEEEEVDSQFRTGKKYPYIEHHTKFERADKESLRKVFVESVELISKDPEWSKRKKDGNSKLYHETVEIKKVKGVKKTEYVKFKILQTLRCYSGEMIEHAMIQAGLHTDTRFCHIHVEEVDTVVNEIFKGLEDCDRIYEEMLEKPGKGYLYFTKIKSNKKKPKPQEEDEEENEGEGEEEEEEVEDTFIEHYQSYSPYVLNGQIQKGFEIREFETFPECIDEYYSKFDAMRVSLKKESAKRKVIEKIDRMKIDFENKILHAQSDIDRCERHARLIEEKIEVVNKALELVNSALSTTMNWEEIRRVFKEQKKSGHPIIRHLVRLDFEKNQIVLQLEDDQQQQKARSEDDDSVSSERNNKKKKKRKRNKKKGRKQQQQRRSTNQILLDLSKSAYGNIEDLYTAKRLLEYKLSKMVEKSEVYFEKTEKKAKNRLKRLQNAAGSDVLKFKKRFWFQKFHWFITSDKYLVLGGRDAQTNDILVKRYMRPNDAYVHPNIHGGASVLVKNRRNSSINDNSSSSDDIPHQTLHEAGVFSVSHSKAWRDKIPIEAYWVHPSQVSKTAEAGEYLTTGAFMVRGKKKFFPHFGSFSKGLAMGVGIMFQVDEESLERRRNGGDLSYNNNNDDDDDDDNNMNDRDGEDGELERGELKIRTEIQFIEKEEEELKLEEEEEEEIHDPQQQQQQQQPEEEEEVKEEEEEEVKLFDWSRLSESEKRRKFNKRDKRRFRKLMKKKGVTSTEATDTVVNEKIAAEKAQIEIRRRKRRDSSSKESSEESVVITSSSSKKKKILSSDEYFYREQMRMGGGGVSPTLSTGSHASSSSGSGSIGGGGKNNKKQKQRKKRRGKKVRKYVDQDEEEKKIRMLLMGIKVGEKPRNRDDYNNNSNVNSSNNTKKDDGENRKIDMIIRRQEKRRKQEEEFGKDLLAEEKKQWEDENEEKKKLSEIDFLVGDPRREDNVLCCVPVYAPYETIKHFKYCVKILPGQMKRGTASKELLNVFQRSSKEVSRENAMIKQITINEMAQCIEANIQIIREKNKKRERKSQDDDYDDMKRRNKKKKKKKKR